MEKKSKISWWLSKPYKSGLLFHPLPPLLLLPLFHSTPATQVSFIFEHARNAAMTVLSSRGTFIIGKTV